MDRSTFLVISLFFSVLACVHTATMLGNGAIIEIETIEPNGGGQYNLDLNAVVNALGGRGGGGRGGGGRGGGAREYQTVVNGQPVTIEIVTDDQLKGYGQMTQSQYLWQQMQQQNRYPATRPNQRPNVNQGNYPNVYITKDTSNPNIEVYDVYTNGGSNNNRYPNYPNQNNNKYPNVHPYPNTNMQNVNRYPNGQNMYPNQHGNMYPYPNQNGQNVNRYPNIYPNPNGQNNDRYPNVYPNSNVQNNNMYPYPNQNGNRYPNMYPNPNGQNNNIRPFPNQNGQNGNIYPNEMNGHNNNQGNTGQENINLSDLNNRGDKDPGTPNKNEDVDNSQGQMNTNAKDNVAGYIDKFPIILLNENEIRR